MKGGGRVLLVLALAMVIPLPAAAGEQEEASKPELTVGVLLEVSALRVFGIANTYIRRTPVQPQVLLGYGDFQAQLTVAQLYRQEGWDSGPFYTAFSMALMLSPRFGWYHPQAGLGVWLSFLPRWSPEDAWATEPGEAPAASAGFLQSYFLRASPFRIGLDIGPLSLDVSLLGFFYGPVMPVTVYPGFRSTGNTVIGLNYGSVGVSFRWGGQ